MQDFPFETDSLGRETTNHGSPDFPVSVYPITLSGNRLGFIDWHWHEELQLCLVTDGAIRVCVSDRRYLLRKGEGVFLGSGVLHAIYPEEGAACTYICLEAEPKLLSSFAGSLMEREYVTPFLHDPALEHFLLRRETPWQGELLDGILRMQKLWDSGAFAREVGMLSELYHIWQIVLLHREELGKDSVTPLQRQHHAAVQSMLYYLSQHYGERITVAMVAKAVSFSEGECCRLFRRVTGTTLFSYLQSYRLNRAAERLADGRDPVSAIAYDCGFCSTSYFVETFRKRMGETPLQYRKRMLRPARSGEEES